MENIYVNDDTYFTLMLSPAFDNVKLLITEELPHQRQCITTIVNQTKLKELIDVLQKFVID